VIYLDYHATTPCDRRVVEAMLPWMTERFGNPHSTSHSFGREAAAAIESARETIATALGVSPDVLVMTSGATESTNLAIDGICRHPRQKKDHIITTTIEHPAVLDPIKRLEKDGFRVTHVPVYPSGHEWVGQVDLEQLGQALDEHTALVSIQWANNEIGVIQPMSEIARMVHNSGAVLHSDATQAVGRIAANAAATDVDLISASAHKFYGPKGVGILTVGNDNRRVRIKPQIVGGGQQRNLRSGTVATTNVIGCATALQLAVEECQATERRIGELRDRLWQGLRERIDGLMLNGPPLDSGRRLAGNLNLVLPQIEGEAWMTATPGVAFSSGSACSSVDAKPSHVLLAIGRSESEARRSVRFGVGKFTTAEEIDEAIEQLVAGFQRISST
jgi:cysteine desulfurase